MQNDNKRHAKHIGEDIIDNLPFKRDANGAICMKDLFEQAMSLFEKGENLTATVILLTIATYLPNNAPVLLESVNGLVDLGLFSTAMPYAQRLTALWPNESRAWTALATVQVGLDQHAAAREALDKAMLINSSDSLSQNRMAAVSAVLQHRMPEAVKMPRNAVQTNGDEQGNWIVLASVLMQQDKWNEVKGILEQAIQLNPTSADAALASAMLKSLSKS